MDGLNVVLILCGIVGGGACLFLAVSMFRFYVGNPKDWMANSKKKRNQKRTENFIAVCHEKGVFSPDVPESLALNDPDAIAKARMIFQSIFKYSPSEHELKKMFWENVNQYITEFRKKELVRLQNNNLIEGLQAGEKGTSFLNKGALCVIELTTWEGAPIKQVPYEIVVFRNENGSLRYYNSKNKEIINGIPYFTVEEQKNWIRTVKPAEVVYTSVTVGGITMGGTHTEGPTYKDTGYENGTFCITTGGMRIERIWFGKDRPLINKEWRCLFDGNSIRVGVIKEPHNGDTERNGHIARAIVESLKVFFECRVSKKQEQHKNNRTVVKVIGFAIGVVIAMAMPNVAEPSAYVLLVPGLGLIGLLVGSVVAKVMFTE